MSTTSDTDIKTIVELLSKQQQSITDIQTRLSKVEADHAKVDSIIASVKSPIRNLFASIPFSWWIVGILLAYVLLTKGCDVESAFPQLFKGEESKDVTVSLLEGVISPAYAEEIEPPASVCCPVDISTEPQQPIIVEEEKETVTEQPKKFETEDIGTTLDRIESKIDTLLESEQKEVSEDGSKEEIVFRSRPFSRLRGLFRR